MMSGFSLLGILRFENEMLERIKNSTVEELEKLAAEIRQRIVETVSKNGGHLASSLGTVELTLALLKVFDLPEDKIIWDVGHQSYPYKILTDRAEKFGTLRQFGGISGFPKTSESQYDFFGTGHGGTSIAAALGIQEAQRSHSGDSKVIAVIGDGSYTSGLALEAMNNLDGNGKNTITVLNDNEMFISTSVGALSKWFSRKLSGQKYSSARREIKQMLSKLPPAFHGDKIIDIIRKTLNSSKSLLTPGILFEGFGYQYVGPIDGHNLRELIETLEDIKSNSEPVLLHIHTVKGKGYEPAERDPQKFHGISPFDPKTGEILKVSPSFTSYLSNYLPKLFRRNPELVAITAAMPDGTGLAKLQSICPSRVYDVGMAEGYAVTFAAGLAVGGKRPVVAIYSTFLQRAYDNIIHDVALQNLPVIFMIDRAGLVGEDGPTHHGLFDIAYCRIIPNMTLMAPRDEHEMIRMLEYAVSHFSTPVAIRYPRGGSIGKRAYNRMIPLKEPTGELLSEGGLPLLVVSVGAMTNTALDAVGRLAGEGRPVSLYDLKFIKPLPEELFRLISEKKIQRIVTVEDGIAAGGAGSAVLEELSGRGICLPVKIIGIEDSFSTHGPLDALRDLEGLSFGKIYDVLVNETDHLNN